MDVYFKEEYGKMCEMIENGNCVTYHFKSNLGQVSHMFIRRKINPLINGKQYYDLITPYGYGGPVMFNVIEENKQQLCDDFGIAFKKYCDEQNIVSEFVRFHPIIKNAKDFKSLYLTTFDRNTLGTNLAIYDDPIQSEFSKGCRKSIRQAIRKGVGYRVTKSPSNIDDFMKIYYSTMKRDNATDFYYFPYEYFQYMLEALNDNILFVEALLEEKTIAAGLYLVSDKTIHTHLSGTLSEYLYLSPAYILRYAATLWGKENGYELIHHGGGTSDSRENSLFKFKKQFANNTEFEYFLGKKIWNQEVYDKLCEINSESKNSNFFPQYRDTNKK